MSHFKAWLSEWNSLLGLSKGSKGYTLNEQSAKRLCQRAVKAVRPCAVRISQVRQFGQSTRLPFGLQCREGRQWRAICRLYVLQPVLRHTLEQTKHNCRQVLITVLTHYLTNLPFDPLILLTQMLLFIQLKAKVDTSKMCSFSCSKVTTDSCSKA